MNETDVFHTPTSVDEVRVVVDDTVKFCAHAIGLANALASLGLRDTPRVVLAYTQFAADLARMQKIIGAGDKPAYEYAQIIPLCGTLKKEMKEQIKHDIYCAVCLIDRKDGKWMNDVGHSLEVTPLGRSTMLDDMDGSSPYISARNARAF